MALSGYSSKGKIIASGLIPFFFLIVMIAYIFGPGSDLLDLGIPLPEITIEKVDFIKSEIQVLVRNTGPIPVEVVMADVNDRIQPAAIEPDRFLERYETALVRIPFEWNEAEPYLIGLTTGDGTRFEKEIEAAAPALKPDLEFAIFFAVIGTYVGIIPVMIGLLWLPFIKKISKTKFHFFLALTGGLLLFLGIDSIEEAFEVVSENLSGSFNGALLIATTIVLSFLGLYYTSEKLTGKADSLKISKPVMIGLLWLPFIKKISKTKFHFFLALTGGLLLFLGIDSIEEAFEVVSESLSGSFNGALLIATTIVLSFLGLYYTSEKLTGKADSLKISKPVAIALMISIGIGLHNFGEGLAIGAAVGLGSIAFSTFLIVGFALHNTTEGLAIAAPMSKGKIMIGKLLGLGMIAGAPAIFGAWVGGFAFSPFSSVIFLSIGAGAIFQVIIIILKWIREEGDKNLSSASVAAGFAIGMLVMYLTSIIV